MPHDTIKGTMDMYKPWRLRGFQCPSVHIQQQQTCMSGYAALNGYTPRFSIPASTNDHPIRFILRITHLFSLTPHISELNSCRQPGSGPPKGLPRDGRYQVVGLPLGAGLSIHPQSVAVSAHCLIPNLYPITLQWSVFGPKGL